MIKLILYLTFAVNSLGLIFSVYSIWMGDELFIWVAIGLFFTLVINYEFLSIINNVEFLMRENKKLQKQLKKLNDHLNNVLEIK